MSSFSSWEDSKLFDTFQISSLKNKKQKTKINKTKPKQQNKTQKKENQGPQQKLEALKSNPGSWIF